VQIEMQLHELVRQRDAAQAQARELTKAMLKFERGEDGSQKVATTLLWSMSPLRALYVLLKEIPSNVNACAVGVRGVLY
jgi:hypothetical protein